MSTNSKDIVQKELSYKVVGLAMEVHSKLGFGFLEKVYENALIFEIRSHGLKVSQQHKIYVYYRKQRVGEYFADLIVENKVIVELKAADSLCKEHEFQLINYLKATQLEVGLLLNFGKKPEFKQKVFSNNNK